MALVVKKHLYLARACIFVIGWGSVLSAITFGRDDMLWFGIDLVCTLIAALCAFINYRTYFRMGS